MESVNDMHVSIEFDKTRTLRYDMAALRDLEAAMGGQPLGAVLNQVKQMGVTALGVALWCGLKHEDKSLSLTLTHKRLERYCDDGKDILVLIDRVAEAIDTCGLFKGAGKHDEQEETPGNGAPEPASTR